MIKFYYHLLNLSDYRFCGLRSRLSHHLFHRPQTSIGLLIKLCRYCVSLFAALVFSLFSIRFVSRDAMIQFAQFVFSFQMN